MIDKIPEPLAGKSILDWAMPVTKAINALPDKIGAVSRNERNRRAGELHPYAVRRIRETETESARWVINLPAAEILTYNGAFVDPREASGVAAAEGNANWYVLDIAESGGDIYLNIEEAVSSGSSTPTLEFATSSKGVFAAIAKAEYDAETKQTTIVQYVSSALHLRSGSGSDVQVDDISINFQDNSDWVQIKDWDKGEPVSASTLAQVLEGEETVPYLIPVRNSGGELEYMSPGQLTGGGGSSGTSGISGSVNVISNVWWDNSELKLKGLGYTWTFTNGVLTEVSDPVTFDVAETVEHSSLHSS